jgi:hypothetical protein
MALRPTPPQPNTATLEPASTRAVLKAAPTPVITPHAIKQAGSSGMAASIFTTLSTCSVANSAITPQPENTESGWLSVSKLRTLPSGSVVKVLAA